MIAYLIGTLEDPDDQAFMENLYQDLERLMFSKARSYVQALEDQRDIVQDTMVKLIQKVAVLRSMNRCALTSYVVSTVRNTAIDFLRGQGDMGAKDVSMDGLEAVKLEDPGPSMEEQAISAERAARLQSIWSGLTEEERILLEGRYFLGSTDKELAAKLNCKSSSIRMMLTRVRRRALELLTEKEEELMV